MQMMNRKIGLSFALAGLLVAGLAAGCGDDSNGSGTGTGAGTSTGTATGTSTGSGTGTGTATGTATGTTGSGAFAACDNAKPCGAGLQCLTFPGEAVGHCFAECVPSGTPACDPGSACVFQYKDQAGATNNACAKTCTGPSDCAAFAGWSCTQGICAPAQPTGTQRAGQKCDGQNLRCDANSSCIGATADDLNCYQPCAGPADCTAIPGSQCILGSQGSTQMYCALQCTDPSGCPNGLSCKPLGSGSVCRE
jgi:hypothetical protein